MPSDVLSTLPAVDEKQPKKTSAKKPAARKPATTATSPATVVVTPGERGPRGDPGISVPGERGRTGASGEQGDAGEKGVGERGPQGDTGQEGRRGREGAPGPSSLFSRNITATMWVILAGGIVIALLFLGQWTQIRNLQHNENRLEKACEALATASQSPVTIRCR